MAITNGQNADANDFISTSAGAADVGKGVKLNASGQLDTSFLAWKGLLGSGQTTRDISLANATQDIAHGLGVVPKYVKVTAFLFGVALGAITIATYVNSTQSSLEGYFAAGGSATGNVFRINTSSGSVAGVITVDATNISIAWTKNSSPTGTAYLLWEVMA